MNGLRLACFLACAAAAAGQPLRELAEKRGVLLGMAHNGNLTEAAYSDTAAREFSQVQHENAMKFGPVHPGQNSYNFGPVDAVVNFAVQHGMRVRGHVMVWHSQLPGWVTNGNYTPAQLSEILHQHIQTVGTRYRGKIYAWDVVNEAFADDGRGSPRPTIWYNQPGIGLEGTGYIEQAFRWAREADPGALLFYNDYSTEAVNAKSDAVFNMAKDFVARGVPIDGIGLQAHFTLGNLGNLASIDANIKRITDLGLQVQITELDVRLPVDAAGKASAADLASQADLYGKFAAVCLKYPLCTAIQTWGFTDKYSWIPGTFAGFGAALPFDAAYQPKGAYNALRDALAAAPDAGRPAPPAPFKPPAIVAEGLVSAASYAGDAVSPGEIVDLFGPTQGPPALVVAQASANGKFPAMLAETRLLFDGVAAPFLFSAPGQVSAIVPFSIAGKTQTQVEYEYQGIRSNAITMPVVATKPALFTADSSGSGLAAALDASYAAVTRATPVDKGGVLLLFLTGGGQTDPVGVDGLVTPGAPLPKPLASVTATIGGMDAPVLYAGGAVGLVQGGLQVNLRVPDGVASGDQPVVIGIGGALSSSKVVVPVR